MCWALWLCLCEYPPCVAEDLVTPCVECAFEERDGSPIAELLALQHIRARMHGSKVDALPPR